jgi:hypothetical protein
MTGRDIRSRDEQEKDNRSFVEPREHGPLPLGGVPSLPDAAPCWCAARGPKSCRPRSGPGHWIPVALVTMR